jgi:hypothetical protein
MLVELGKVNRLQWWAKILVDLFIGINRQDQRCMSVGSLPSDLSCEIMQSG